METVAFYSYKGGVGRTLLVANTALFLALCGRSVVVLDLDFEAPGLHEKLATQQSLQMAAKGEMPGAVDLLLSIVTDGESTKHIADYAMDISQPQSSKGSLVLMPAGSAPAPAYWTSLDRLNKALRQSVEDDGLAEAVLELQARIADAWSPDYLLIDSRTGITELGGLATSLLADRVVCLTTSSRESINGTKVVAQALRDTPRLKSQKALHLDFVVSRTEGRWNDKAKELAAELGGEVTVLPHDSWLARSEQTLVNNGASRQAGDDDEKAEPRLFAATLDWIANTFKQEKKAANAAQKRMLAVNWAWQEMTRTREIEYGGSWHRDAWPIARLRERVAFERHKQQREADIAAYDSPPEQKNSKLQMVVEYSDNEDDGGIARWWIENTDADIVILLKEKFKKEIYYRKKKYHRDVSKSSRWDIPLPGDFDKLASAGDTALDSLLDSVRRGHDSYLDRIVEEWIHSSHSTLHGGAPWRPGIARKILDTLAQVKDPELARRVLWTASGTSRRFSRRFREDDDRGAATQIQSELFAPLLWRLPVSATMGILDELRHGMHSKGRGGSGNFALANLAQILLGLIYDPDAYFRSDGQRRLSNRMTFDDVDEDRGLYDLSSHFRCTELRFGIEDIWPDFESDSDFERMEHRRIKRGSGNLAASHLNDHQVSVRGWLGDFESRTGKVRLFEPVVNALADRISVDSQHLASVALLNLTITGLAFVGRDLDGQMSSMQPIDAPPDSAYGTAPAFTALMQYLTYRYLLKLQDPGLLRAFDAMCDVMTPPHRAWRRIKEMPLEDARTWLLNLRRGTGGSPWAMHLTSQDG